MYYSFVEPHECQLKALLPFIDEGFLEYTNWTEFNPYDPERTQMAAYYNGQLRYEDTAKYWVHFDDLCGRFQMSSYLCDRRR